MNLDLSGRGVLITGGASGIGLGCVQVLADEGAKVAVLDRNGLGRESAFAAGAACFVEADVSVEEDVRRGIAIAAAELNGIELVVCSAGVSGPVGALPWEISSEQWDAVMAVNAKGPFLVLKNVVAHLTTAEHPAAVIIASDGSWVATPGMTPYCASKGAALMLTRAMSLDLESRAIRVNCVCPSVVDTPMSRSDLGLPDGFDGVGVPVINAREIGRHVAYLLSPLSASINGTALAVDFGYMARSAYPDAPFRALLTEDAHGPKATTESSTTTGQ